MKNLLLMLIPLLLVGCIPLEDTDSNTEETVESGYVYKYMITYQDDATEIVYSEDSDPELLEGGIVNFIDVSGAADKYIAVKRWELLSKQEKGGYYE